MQSGGRPLRVFYAFDPKRQAVLLLGGDKTGNDQFYERYVPKAERSGKAYLEEIGDEDKGDVTMKVHRFEDLKKKKLSAVEQKEVDSAVEAELLEMDLRAMRELLDLTQEDVARIAEMTQSEISRLERRGDHRLSTLRRIVQSPRRGPRGGRQLRRQARPPSCCWLTARRFLLSLANILSR